MIKKFLANKQGNYKVVQWPNPPLYLWLICTVIARFSEGDIKTGFSALATAAIFTWAYLEIIQGESYFRKALGFVVVFAVIYGFFSP